MVDPDVLFAYKTEKRVKILDRKLGFLYYGIILSVLVYIAVFVFYMNEGYLARELAIGQVKIIVRGGGLMVKSPGGDEVAFDSHDLRAPAMENGALFVVTKIEAVRQSRGICGNPDFKCSSASDCPAFAVVSTQECKAKLCEMHGWCPPLGSDDTVVWDIASTKSNVSTWFRTAIQFPEIAPGRVFTNMDNDVPAYAEDNGPYVDTWYLNDILKSLGLTVASLADTGAMLNVRMQWDCNIDTGEGCKAPQIQPKRLDAGHGYSYMLPKYIRSPDMDANKDERLLFRMTGIRILVVSKGEGFGFSVAATILQLSAALALLTTANLVTDFVMMKLLSEKRHYTDYKQQDTPDFSDVRDLMQSFNKRSRVGAHPM